MIDQTHTVTINRPVNEVFDFVADPSNETDWHLDVKEVMRSNDGPYQIGERFQWRINFGGLKSYSLEVTALEPNRFIELTTYEGPVAHPHSHLPAGRRRHPLHAEDQVRNQRSAAGPGPH